MSVLVDTSVWSLALRRSGAPSQPHAGELAELIQQDRAVLIGPIRQELLSGVRTKAQFDRLRRDLQSFPDLPLETADYEAAAASWNQCRASGVQGSSIDLLICAVAERRRLAIYTTDKDFTHYARILGIRLHAPRV